MVTNLLFFNVFTIKRGFILTYILHGIQTLPDYEYYDIMKESKEIYYRKNFLPKNYKNEEIATISNNTEYYVDGILHFKNTQAHPQRDKVNDIEKDFSNLFKMKDVKYTYLRDTFWRTWREVKTKNGGKSIVHYRLQTTLNICPKCGTSVFWTIEDGLPPCPYEIVSVINDDTVCAINYSQLNEDLGSCPSVITYRDITKTCDNPIVTKWRFEKVFKNNITEQNNNICGTEIFCEISTLYQIVPDYVVFRIINANDDIIYSRIMQNDNVTYVCIIDCGRYNKKTIQVTSTDNPLAIDLVQSLPPKKDRENEKSSKNKKKNKLKKKLFQQRVESGKNNLDTIILELDTTLSPCKKIKDHEIVDNAVDKDDSSVDVETNHSS